LLTIINLFFRLINRKSIINLIVKYAKNRKTGKKSKKNQKSKIGKKSKGRMEEMIN